MAKNANSALDRLFDLDKEDKNSYSIEEQLESADELEDAFLDGMSDESKNALYERVKPVKVEFTSEEESSVEDDIERPKERPAEPDEVPKVEVREEILEQKPKKKSTRRKTKKEDDNMMNTILDVLVNDLIQHLLDSGYEFHNFDKNATRVIIEYMDKKLKGEK